MVRDSECCQSMPCIGLQIFNRKRFGPGKSLIWKLLLDAGKPKSLTL